MPPNVFRVFHSFRVLPVINGRLELFPRRRVGYEPRARMHEFVLESFWSCKYFAKLSYARRRMYFTVWCCKIILCGYAYRGEYLYPVEGIPHYCGIKNRAFVNCERKVKYSRIINILMRKKVHRGWQRLCIKLGFVAH